MVSGGPSFPPHPQEKENKRNAIDTVFLLFFATTALSAYLASPLQE